MVAIAPDTSRIWLTSKARMNAENRLRAYALWSHLALSWYSFLLIVLSVFEKQLSAKFGQDLISPAAILLSVLLFGLSLIFSGFKFEEQANSFRECYLRLQKIINGGAAAKTQMKQYNDLLDHYPNHQGRDYDLVIFSAWRKKQKLTNAAGEIKVTKRMIFAGYCRSTFWIATMAIIFL